MCLNTQDINYLSIPIISFKDTDTFQFVPLEPQVVQVADSRSQSIWNDRKNLKHFCVFIHRKLFYFRLYIVPLEAQIEKWLYFIKKLTKCLES